MTAEFAENLDHLIALLGLPGSVLLAAILAAVIACGARDRSDHTDWPRQDWRQQP